MYPVFLVESLGAPRNHQSLLVEIHSKRGTIFHVTGNIQEGMVFEVKDTDTPEQCSPTFISRSEIGKISSSKLSLFKQICEANPPPTKQFNGPRRLDPTKPLRRCQEWTLETINALRAQGDLE
jgi:hypothetical protein